MTRRIRSLFFRYTIALLSLGILLFMMLVLLVYNGYYGELPSEESLKKIVQNQTTRILDKDGRLISKLYLEDRSDIKLADISPHVPQILVSIEDKRFYEHHGIDYRSLGRVLIKSIILRDESSGGGSTITQQLAKNLYPRIQHKYLYYAVNKLREMIIATRLEDIYSKDQILNLYLNTVSFGMDIYGIESAAQRVFSKSAKELTMGESAVLVGSLKATTLYHPILNPSRSFERRNDILTKMSLLNYINEKDLAVNLNLPLGTKPSSTSAKQGGYFIRQVTKEASEIINKLDPGLNLQTSGLTIHTTLDIRLQGYAEQAVKTHLSKLQKLIDLEINEDFWAKNPRVLDSELSKLKTPINEDPREINVFSWEGNDSKTLNTLDSIKYYLKFLQTGLLATDPVTGEIKAWVGGIDPIHFSYDHVLSRRQVGSTFKPFIYATALEKGISPCNYYETSTVSYEVDGETWTPNNASMVEDEELTMATALQRSVNTVSVKILNEAGIDETIQLVRRGGIKSNIPEVPSIALGTASLSLKEMVEAYSAFVNKGWNLPIYMVEEIVDREGNSIYKHQAGPRRKVFSEETGRLMNQFLQEVVDSGTGHELRSVYNVHNNLGGKTGTTQNNSDGWFIGVSPRLVAGVWVGGEYPSISFATSEYGQGARMALPIYAHFYQAINKDDKYSYISNSKFELLPEYLSSRIECNPIKEEFSFWEWLRSNVIKKGSKKLSKTDSSSSETKPKLFDRIKSVFKRKKKSN